MTGVQTCALPISRAGKQARVMQMLQMGIISPAKAYKFLDMGDFRNLQAQFEADENQADREHEKLMNGEPVNEAAAEDAKNQMLGMALSPPMDENGQPIPPNPQQVAQLMDAGLQPLPYENKAVHLDAHGSYMKSVEFESLPSDVKQRFYKHFELTQQEIGRAHV